MSICPYCDWWHCPLSILWLVEQERRQIQISTKVTCLDYHFSEDIFTALSTMLECIGGPCSLCGDSLPQRIGGWDKRNKKKEKENYKMFFKQALRNSCELLREILIFKELHGNSWNYLQAYETACKHMKLHASIWNCMQTYGTSCKLQAYGTACKVR